MTLFNVLLKTAIEYRRMNFSSRILTSKASMNKTFNNTFKNSISPFRSSGLGKFSTSDFDQQTYNQSQPWIEQQDQNQTQKQRQNIVVSLVERPCIDCKLVNSIFPSQKVQKIKTQKAFSNKFLLPSTFNEKDKVLNDYVVSKIKNIINQKRTHQQIHITKSKLEQYYSNFLEKFSITDLKKVFQCLQTNRNISLSKQYIINQLLAYYSSRSRQKQNKKQNYQNILQIKMNSNLISKHQSRISQVRQNIASLSTHRKQIKRQSISTPIHHKTTHIKKYSNLIDEELRMSKTELVKQTQIVNRLQKTQNALKKTMCKKVDVLLSSGQYCESGFGSLYNDFVENGLDQRVFSAFLGPKQMQFLKQKSYVQRQIYELQNASYERKPMIRLKTKNQISKLKNQMIVMQQDIINKLKNDRHLEKNVFSLFGCGQRGKTIIERVRLNSPIKN